MTINARFEYLYVGNHSELDTHVQMNSYITSPTLPTPKILALPPESPCIVSNIEVAFG